MGMFTLLVITKTQLKNDKVGKIGAFTDWTEYMKKEGCAKVCGRALVW